MNKSADDFEFHNYGPRGVNEAVDTQPRIVLVPDDSDLTRTEALKNVLIGAGFQVSILDEFTEYFRDEIRQLREEYMAHHDLPANVECLEAPKSAFQKRQEWLESLRKGNRKGKKW